MEPHPDPLTAALTKCSDELARTRTAMEQALQFRGAAGQIAGSSSTAISNNAGPSSSSNLSIPGPSSSSNLSIPGPSSSNPSALCIPGPSSRSKNLELENALRVANDVNSSVTRLFSKSSKDSFKKGKKTKPYIEQPSSNMEPSPHHAFSREVIVCRNRSITETLNKEEKEKHRKLNLMIRVFSFHKDWSEEVAREKLKAAFPGKDLGIFEFLIAEDGILVPVIVHNTDLNGKVICSIYARKTVYLRPSVDIDTLVPSNEDPVFRPRKLNRCEARSSLASNYFPSSSDSEPEDLELTEDLSSSVQSNKRLKFSNLPSTSSYPLSNIDSSHSAPHLIEGAQVVQERNNTRNSAIPSDHSYIHIPASEQSQIDDDYLLAVRLSCGDQNSTENTAQDHTQNTSQAPTENSVWDIIQRRQRSETTAIFDFVPKTLTVSRSRPIESLERYASSSAFNVWLKFKVKFAGEFGVDTGGLMREFLDLLISHIVKSSMFYGDGTTKNMTMSIPHLQKRTYYLAGVAVALTVIHGGPPPKFMSKSLFDMIMEKPTSSWDPSKIDNLQWKQAIEDLQQSNPAAGESTRVLQNPIFNELQLDTYITENTELEAAVDACLEYYFRHRIAAPLKQFTEGLSCFGFLELVKDNEALFEPFFVATDEKLTAEKFEQLCEVHRSFDQQGPKFALERDILANFTWFLEELEEEKESVQGLTLENLLGWITGSSAVPIGGFSKLIDVNFMHGKCKTLPEASSCSLALYLPVTTIDYAEFRNFMVLAMTEGIQFGSI